jgi:hypothetical protein
MVWSKFHPYVSSRPRGTLSCDRLLPQYPYIKLRNLGRGSVYHARFPLNYLASSDALEGSPPLITSGVRMFSTDQVLQILVQVSELARDKSLRMQMLWESWDGACHTADEVLVRFLSANGIPIPEVGALEEPVTVLREIPS